jgi:NuA3 HAT complex component NTO1
VSRSFQIAAGIEPIAEPLEIDLERQVEYDMDEQGTLVAHLSRLSQTHDAADQEWLDAVNTERKKEQLDKVTYEVFEVVMDRLEKEWFNLVRRLGCSVSG